jgi:putative ABC transport system ATP-binding protein
VAIIGKSGSGKTTLLSLLSGLETPDEGMVNLLGTDIASLASKDLGQFRANHFSIIFQQFHLLPMLTAIENIIIALELKGEADAYDKAMEALKLVGLDHRANHLPHQLSGGESQRVALARAVVTKPKNSLC